MLENNHKRKSLGRGLGALLGDEADFLSPMNGVHEGDEVTVEISCLVPGRYQPRRDFDEEALNALADSISEKGILQPLLVRSVDNGKYEIIAGERRFRAAEKAGLSSVPVIIKNMDDREVLEVALIENLLRENLSAIEEAEGLKRLMDEFAHTQDALAKVVGKSRSHIANTLRLLTLPPEVRRMIEDKVLTAGQARPLVGLDNALELAEEIVARGLNARQAEALAARSRDPAKKSAPREKSEKDEDLEEISSFITQSLGMKVKISASRDGGGKVVLQYSSAADLDKIIDILRQRSTLPTDIPA